MVHSSTQLGWEDLPYEIISAIISQIRDLGSLCALFHASPYVYRSFGAAARNLVEDIFASGYVCGHTAVLFRLCALIRTGKLPVNDTHRFREHVTSEALVYDTRIRESKTGIAPRSLDKDIDSSIVRSLLVVARLASNLAADCLAVYIEHLKSIRPQHPLEVERFNGYGYLSPQKEWQARPEGRFVKISVCDQVSWDEEQRAMRAVWRLQLIFELKRAVKAGILEWTDASALFSTKAIDAPTHITPPRSKPSSFYGARDNYYDLVYENRRATGSLWGDSRYDFCSYYSPEYEEINSVTQFVERQYGTDMADGMRNGTIGLTDLRCDDNPSRFHQVLQPSEKDWKKLIWASSGVNFYFKGRYRANRSSTSCFAPLLYTTFDEFAAYGFAFWSYVRMADCGLLIQKRKEREVTYHYAWSSLLAEEDLRRIERLDQETSDRRPLDTS